MSIIDVVPLTQGLAQQECSAHALKQRQTSVLGEHPACANAREHEGAEGLGGLHCRLHLG